MSEDRPEGLHLGQVVRELMKGKNPTWNDGPLDEDGAARIQAGFMWERAVELSLGGVPAGMAMEIAFKQYMSGLRIPPAKQLRVTYDGLHMTPDADRPEDGVIESYKLTWKSMKKIATVELLFQHFEHWLVAEMGYCKALGRRIVEWYVFLVMGDYTYKPGSGAQVAVFRTEFTDAEIEHNWLRIQGQRRLMEGARGNESDD